MTTPVEGILVALSEQTVAQLIARRRFPNERLADIVTHLASTYASGPNRLAANRPQRCATGHRYCLHILGERRTVGSLAEALAFVLNTLADLDIGILDRLERTGGRTRRNVARNREAIHPGRPDLNEHHTLQFRPGWWIGDLLP